MEPLRQNDIIIVPFPFSDRATTKVRPALIVSGDAFNQGEDVIICAMTTNQQRSEPGFIITNADLSEGSLITPGYVRVGSILRIHKSLVLRRIARAKHATQATVEQTLLSILRSQTGKRKQ